jgi:hypothetical protein
MKKEYLTENQDWVTFYPTISTNFYIEKAGYFDERPQIHTSVTQIITLLLLPFLILQSLWFLFLLPFVFFGWGSLYINLPIRTGIQDCESAAWGFNYHDNTIWIYIGGAGNFEGGKKWVTFRMPWYYTWVRTSTLMKDGYDWFHETSKNRQKWEKDDEGVIIGSYNWVEKNKWSETYEYIDLYDNTILNATIGVSEREWRPLWFKWTSLFAKKRKTIDVNFDQEVGREKGSWKGGVLGCGYEILPNETPLQCLKRMEKERNF